MLEISARENIDSAQLFAAVAGRPWALYFDSGNTRSRPPRAESERYDILMFDPLVTLVTIGGKTTIDNGHDVLVSEEDPLRLIQQVVADELGQAFDIAPSAGYLPGAYGYFAYDLARRFEVLPALANDDEQLPEMAVGIYGTIVVIDHAERLTKVISLKKGLASHHRWLTMIDEILGAPSVAFEDQSLQPGEREQPLQAKDLQENLTREQYQNRFERVRRYTVAGDCYQVNLSKRFAAEVRGSSWATYLKLRYSSPAPYGAFLSLPFADVLSNSPESFIRCRGRAVVTSPIKGTRPRDHSDPARDRRIARELADSEKDRAENLMIVDLMRNDLSRCCELGSVKVPSLFSLHSFANVHHLISTVTGVLREGYHALDLLRSCFPGGSITGAPKIRAMQIIEELEPHRRGLYCGSIAYLGMDGSLETSIAIRTIVVKDGVARFSAGGGLVIDSEESEEYQELLDKASMMKAAIFGE